MNNIDKFSQTSVSSDIMGLVYKYDKSFREVLSDLNMLNEHSDILDAVSALESYYKEKQKEHENE